MAIFGKKEVCLLIKGQFRYTIAKTGEIARKTVCKVVKKFEGKKLYNHEMSHVSCRCL